MLRSGTQFNLSLESQKRSLTAREPPARLRCQEGRQERRQSAGTSGLTAHRNLRRNREARNAPETPGRAARTAQVASWLDHKGFFWQRSQGGGDNAVSDAVPNQPS
jgi:hypothetical protein